MGLDEINATDINVLASVLDPRYKSLKFLDAEKISEIETELEDQISQLTCDGEANSSSLSSSSQIIPPPANEKSFRYLVWSGREKFLCFDR